MKLDPHVQEVLAQLDWLKRLASRETRDCHAADEALQDALVRALQLRPRATAGPQLRSWLRSVLHAVARERVRRDSRRRWRERLAAEPIESASDPLECEATSQLVRRALERVREPYGSAVRLRYFEGLSAAEAALRLEITPDAVRQRVSRGLRILRSELERDHLRGDVHTRRSRLGALLAFVRRQRPRTRLVLGTSLAVIAFAAFIPWLWSGRPAAVSAWPGVARAATSLGQHVAVRPARRARLDSVAQAPARSARPGELPLVAAAASELALEPQLGAHFGRSLARLGDLDGDGRTEIAVGADAGGSQGDGEGQVWILSVGADGAFVPRNRIPQPASPQIERSSSHRALFGHRVTRIDDLDGNGVPELCVGAPGYQDPRLSPLDGRVWLFFLERSGGVRARREISSFTEPACARVFELHDGDRFGQGLACLGDLDGNGAADLAVGAGGADGERGALWIVFLRGDGSVLEERRIGPDELFFGAQVERHFGVYLEGAGDLDGDGNTELVVVSDGPARVLSLAPDGRVVAISAHETFSGSVLFLGSTPEGGARYAYGNASKNDRRGCVELHDFELDFVRQAPRR